MRCRLILLISPLLIPLRFSMRGLFFFLVLLFDWDSFCSLRISSLLVCLPFAMPLSFLGCFYGSTSPYLLGFLLPSLTCNFGAFAPSALLLPSCNYFFSFLSSSSSLRIFFFLGCPGIHSGVSRRFSLSSPSPTAISLFPLDRSPLGSLSSLLLSFYPFGVFRRLCLLSLDFALVLLFLEFFSSSRLIGLRSYFFVCAVSSAGFYAPHVLSPSFCHLVDPDILLRVLALPLLHSSAPPF